MLMSYPPSHHHHASQQSQLPPPPPPASSSNMYAMAPPAALTASDMQRRRDAYSATTATAPSAMTPPRSLGTPSSRHAPLHDQKYDPRDATGMLYAPSDSAGSSAGADASERQHYHPQHRMYSMPSPFASHAPSAFDFMHSSGGGSSTSQHQSSHQQQPPHAPQLMPHAASARIGAPYGASTTPSPTSAHSAVHPMTQDMSAWGSLPYTSSGPPPTHAPGAPASSSLADMRSDFGESHGGMFAIEDEYNDAKILREVLQDQAHHHHQTHQSDAMPSRHGLSYPLPSQQQLHHHHHDAPPSYSSYSSMGLMGPSVDASHKVGAGGMYMGLDHLAQLRGASTSMAPAPLSLASSSSSSSSKPLTSPSSSYVSSSAGSPLGSSRSSSTSSAVKKKPASRICRMPGCTKGIRSRGLCKGHGGGRRCTTPGCEISDQGGGHCIAHGGGKRCNVAGCQKSAQSKGLCKLHGGARRCKILNCSKNCQIKGLCRLHYSMYAAAAASGPQGVVPSASSHSSGSGASFSPSAPFPMSASSAGAGASFV